tara:strand:- start:2825 stop:3070 length:246 start_codon:yes stop_codon:yes gene_type:complete
LGEKSFSLSSRDENSIASDAKTTKRDERSRKNERKTSHEHTEESAFFRILFEKQQQKRNKKTKREKEKADLFCFSSQQTRE